MVQIFMLTILCGMLSYSILSYIFLTGIDGCNSKFFWLKCGIISIGIVFIYLLFRDMVVPVLDELTQISRHPFHEYYTYKTIIIVLLGSLAGYLGHKINIKE